MPRYIMKLTDPQDECAYYLEWSTIVDAPVTYGMALDDFRRYYRERYGTEGAARLPARLERVEATGCSAFNDSVDGLLATNRAGPDESKLNLEGVLDRYCRRTDDLDGPLRAAQMDNASIEAVERIIGEMSE